LQLNTLKSNEDVRDSVAYCTKYIVKQSEDRRFLGSHRFYASKDLIKPTIIRDDIQIEMLKWYIPEEKKIYDERFSNKYLGEVHVQKYFIPKIKEQDFIVSHLPFLPLIKNNLNALTF